MPQEAFFIILGMCCAYVTCQSNDTGGKPALTAAERRSVREGGREGGLKGKSGWERSHCEDAPVTSLCLIAKSPQCASLTSTIETRKHTKRRLSARVDKLCTSSLLYPSPRG